MNRDEPCTFVRTYVCVQVAHHHRTDTIRERVYAAHTYIIYTRHSRTCALY